jgi:signal transduction histidine kinase/CheY-like chemotaxis protein
VKSEEVAKETARVTDAVPEGHWCGQSPDALVGLDDQWRVLFFNRSARDLLPAGDTLDVGAQPWQCAGLLAILEALHLDQLSVGEHSPNRTIRLVETGQELYEIAVAVSGEPRKRTFTLSIRDESRKKPDQRVLYRSQKGQVIGALAGGIAHDFNNILTAVIGHLELALLNKELSPMHREFLVKAQTSARRGAELNARLLEFSRQTEARPVIVDVPRLVEETIFLLRRGLDRRIQIQFQPPTSAVWPARVDPGQLVQVLMQLSLNARDAMPEGGELAFELANHTFAVTEARPPRQPGEFVGITVRDTGHGMTPEVLERLFEPYFTTKGFGKGAGLGLSIANHVVVEHGGWMEVESKPGAGSRFHVFLPRAGAAAAAGEPVATVPPAGAALEGRETVLLVDDEEPVRAVIQAMLTFRGYQVIEAKDGEEAVERLRTGGSAIGIVLLDIQMPRMNGWDTLEKIHGLNPRIPVLMLSGGVSDPPGDGSGMNRTAGMLRKPFASEELLRSVRKALDAGMTRTA